MKEERQLVHFITSIAPKSMLIEMMEEVIQEYKSNPTDENFEKVSTVAMTLMLKSVLENTGKDPFEAVSQLEKEMGRLEDLDKLFKPNKS